MVGLQSSPVILIDSLQLRGQLGHRGRRAWRARPIDTSSTFLEYSRQRHAAIGMPPKSVGSIVLAGHLVGTKLWRKLFCDRPHIGLLAANLAGRQGLEPRFTGPEPVVLPLNDLPVVRRIADYSRRLPPRQTRRAIFLFWEAIAVPLDCPRKRASDLSLLFCVSA